jgi:hypothetical protein
MTPTELAIIALVVASIALQFIMMRILLRFVDSRLQKLDSIMGEAIVNAIESKVEMLTGADYEAPNPWAALATEYMRSRMPMGPVTELVPKKDEKGRFISDNI